MWCKVLHFHVLLLVSLLPVVHGVLENEQEHVRLITESVIRLSEEFSQVEKDANVEVFVKSVGKGGGVRLRSDKWPDKVFTIHNGYNDSRMEDKKVFVVDKTQDGLPLSETNTHIVLIQSRENWRIYVAHKVYIRTMDEELSVEWDTYETKLDLVYKSFYTALTPTDYYKSKAPIQGKKNDTAEDEDLSRTFAFIAHIKNRIKDVACLVTVFLPKWCEKMDLKASSEEESGSAEETENGRTRSGSNEQKSDESQDETEESLEDNRRKNKKPLRIITMGLSSQHRKNLGEDHMGIYDNFVKEVNPLGSRLQAFNNFQPTSDSEMRIKGSASDESKEIGNRQRLASDAGTLRRISLNPESQLSAKYPTSVQQQQQERPDSFHKLNEEIDGLGDSSSKENVVGSSHHVDIHGSAKEQQRNGDNNGSLQTHERGTQTYHGHFHYHHKKMQKTLPTKTTDSESSEGMETTTPINIPERLKPGSSSSSSSESQESLEKKSLAEKEGIPPVKGKFTCPTGSGAILNGTRCYCPAGTILKDRKCLRKRHHSEEVDETNHSTKPTSTARPGSNTTTRIPMWEKSSHPRVHGEAEGFLYNNVDMTTAIMGRRKRSLEQKENKNQSRRYHSPKHHSKKHSKDNVSSTTPYPFIPREMEEDGSLGPFFKDLLKVYFTKDKADQILKTVSKKAMEFFRDRYKIGNNKENGHPVFESSKIPFTGLMDCEFVEKKLSSFNGTTEENIVDYLLHSLRAQCHHNIRHHTLKLFNQHVVYLFKRLHYTTIKINQNADLLTKKVFTKAEWQDYISAIFLSKYSEVFFEERGLMQRRLTDSLSPDGKRISQGVKTMSLFTERVMDLLKHRLYQQHAVKISKAVVQSSVELIAKIHKQEFIIDVFCKGCATEHEVYAQDRKQLLILADYVMNGFDSILHESLGFEEFYINKVNAKKGVQ